MSVDFYNTKNIGTFRIGSTQVNKLVPFKTTEGVFIDSCKIEIFYNKKLIKGYVMGSGLILSGSNIQGSEKTLLWTLNGSDFSSKLELPLVGRCTFFTLGDVEVEFRLEVIW